MNCSTMADIRWQPEPLTRNESVRFGALNSDSTHHIFRNACTKSGFHSFLVADWFCLFIYLWVLTFPLEDCSEFGNFVITLISCILNLSVFLIAFIFVFYAIIFSPLSIHWISEQLIPNHHSWFSKVLDQ